MIRTTRNLMLSGRIVCFSYLAIRDFRARLPVSHRWKTCGLPHLARQLETCLAESLQTNPRIFRAKREALYHTDELTFALRGNNTVVRIRPRRTRRKTS